MKIAIIIESLTFSGGGQRQVLELALNLQRMGNKVDVFCKSVNKIKCYPHIINNINIFSLKKTFNIKLIKGNSIISKIINLLISKFIMFINTFKLIRLIKLNNKFTNYDVINYHDGTYVIGLFFEKRQNIWMMNDTQGGLNKNLLYSDKKTLINKILFLIGIINAKTIKFYIKKIIVLDNLNKKIIFKYSQVEIYIIKSGLDKNKFTYNEKNKKIKNKKIKFLCTSIFSRHRRYEDIILALSIIKEKGYNNFSLDIIGNNKHDINYYNEIINIINNKNLNSHINILGTVEEKILIEKYNKADIFLYPNFPQTWGLAIFEAMYSGCVTIITKGCGAHEVLENDVNTLIVDIKSPNEFAKAIIYLINNEEKFNKIKLNGKKFVEENISWKKYSKKMEEIFLKN